MLVLVHIVLHLGASLRRKAASGRAKAFATGKIAFSSLPSSRSVSARAFSTVLPQTDGITAVQPSPSVLPCAKNCVAG